MVSVVRDEGREAERDDGAPDEQGPPVLTQQRFGRYLTAHGYPSDNNATGRGIVRLRIALLSPAEDDSDSDSRYETANLANLSNLSSRKSPIGNSHEGLSESIVSKVSKVSTRNDVTPERLCALCQQETTRWDDHGVQRCVACYPPPEKGTAS